MTVRVTYAKGTATSLPVETFLSVDDYSFQDNYLLLVMGSGRTVCLPYVNIKKVEIE